MRVERALISVWDKTGLDEFVKGLHRLGVKIISTGGTSKSISSLGIPVEEISDYTGFGEMLDGRVKTLHPKVHAGILALRDNSDHVKKVEEEGIPFIDMVVVNLYPFEEKVLSRDITRKEAIEYIDIGGPAMLRSAAKNFLFCAAVSSPSQYGFILKELEENNCQLKEATLKALASDVFMKTSQYDGHIADYLAGDNRRPLETFPARIELEFEKICDLRYGENPHQKAAFYKDITLPCDGIVNAEHLHGKELSFNNILDLASAFEIARCFDEPAVSIVKHGNPCGVAAAGTLEKAFLDALACDPESAFGGIMAFNRQVTKYLAEVIREESLFLECIIAPGYEKDALEIFGAKKNLRILKLPFDRDAVQKGLDLRKIPGAILLQERDAFNETPLAIRWVTEKKSAQELEGSLLFGLKVVRFVKSNAIVISQGTKTVGIGAGQMSRVDSVQIAIRKAASRSIGAVLASDAFFPKSDSIEEAAKAGISAIIQPGGSIRDKDVIDACNHFGIAMAFTGVRHFRH